MSRFKVMAQTSWKTAVSRDIGAAPCPQEIHSKKFSRSPLAQGVGWNLTDRCPTPTLKLAYGWAPHYG